PPGGVADLAPGDRGPARAGAEVHRRGGGPLPHLAAEVTDQGGRGGDGGLGRLLAVHPQGRHHRPLLSAAGHAGLTTCGRIPGFPPTGPGPRAWGARPLSGSVAPVVIGSLVVTLHVPESHSLKEKRQVVRSVVERVRRTFNVAVAEVDDQDTWQLATLGVACISGDGRHAD